MRFKLFFVLLFVTGLRVFCVSQNLTREQRIKIEVLLQGIKLNKEDIRTIALCNKVLEIDPNNYRAIGYRAFANFGSKNYVEAIKDFNTVQKFKPQSILLVYRAQIKAELGDTTGAMADVNLVSSFYKNEPDLLLSMGRVYFTLKKYSMASLFYEKASHLDKSNLVARTNLIEVRTKQMDHIGAEKICNELINTSKQQIFIPHSIFSETFFLKANICFLLEQYKDALNALRSAIFLNPENLLYYDLAIKLSVKTGDYKIACLYFTQAKLIDKHFNTGQNIGCPNLQNDTILLGAIKKDIACAKLLKLADLALRNDTNALNSAVYYYSQVIEKEPKHLFALAGRADCYRLLKQYENSVNDLNEVLKLMPKSSESYSRRSYNKKQLTDYKASLADADKAIYYDSSNVTLWIERSKLKIDMKDSIGAMLDLSKALSLNDEDQNIYFERGYLFLEVMKNYEAALKSFLKAIDLLENKNIFQNPKYYYFSAVAYDKLGKYDMAIIELDKAIALDANSGFYYFTSGEIKARAKDIKGACVDWKKAKQMGYGDAQSLILYNCE